MEKCLVNVVILVLKTLVIGVGLDPLRLKLS